jgi:copper chaperone
LTPSEKAYYKVVGIYCTTCKPIIEKQLKDKNGIKKIDINNITNTVIVEFDPLAITKHDIKAKLEESGYKFVTAAQY